MRKDALPLPPHFREFAAAYAMQGYLANVETCRVVSKYILSTKRLFAEEFAVMSIEQADYLIHTLRNMPPPPQQSTARSKR
jgi:hypothetical protein